MRVRCVVCDTDDIPETDEMGLDTTARDHLRIWHPDEWWNADIVNGVLVLTPSEYVPPDTEPDPLASDEMARPADG